MPGVNEGTPAWSRDGTYFVTSAALRYVVDRSNSSDPIYPLRYPDDETENAYINVDDEFPYVDGFELIRVSVTGEAERLSFLTTTYFSRQSDWVWSSDETRIAFWLTLSEDDESLAFRELAVLDVESGEVTNYCISGKFTPIWSPDGRQIAINRSLEESSTYMIVDLEEKIAVSIAGDDDTRIGGWMVSVP